MPYEFGWPSRLVDIHFPTQNDLPTNESAPWFWYIGPPERPFYYQFIGVQAGGHGWQRTQNAPMIKIIAADTQVLQPTPVLGFNSIEDAIRRGQADYAWGRFEFQDPFFWKVIGIPKPPFTTIQGRPTIKTQKGQPPISTKIKNAVTQWKNFWNFGANSFNQNAGTVSGADQFGNQEITYPFPKTKFAVPLPDSQSVAAAAVQVQQQKAYLGPVPGGFWFEGGVATIFKQAYSFQMQIGQLSFTNWNMSHFPPTENEFGFETRDCSGYGQTTFPLAGPQIIGGGGG